MWALSTCGEPDEIKKNTHPKYITDLVRDQDLADCRAFCNQIAADGGKDPSTGYENHNLRSSCHRGCAIYSAFDGTALERRIAAWDASATVSPEPARRTAGAPLRCGAVRCCAVQCTPARSMFGLVCFVCLVYLGSSHDQLFGGASHRAVLAVLAVLTGALRKRALLAPPRRPLEKRASTAANVQEPNWTSRPTPPLGQ